MNGVSCEVGGEASRIVLVLILMLQYSKYRCGIVLLKTSCYRAQARYLDVLSSSVQFPLN